MPMSKHDLEQAKANLKAYARKEITKREMIQFRCESDLMARLLDLAANRKQPLGPMIRNWVEERLNAEESGKPDPQVAAFFNDLDKLREKYMYHAARSSEKSIGRKKAGGTRDVAKQTRTARYRFTVNESAAGSPRKSQSARKPKTS